MRSALLASALLLAACTPKEFHCVGDQECVGSDGRFGVCVDTHCAFRDEGCTGGLRFDDTAGSEAKLCVTQAQLFEHLDAGVPKAGPDAPVSAGPDAPAPDAPAVVLDAPLAEPDAPLAEPDAPPAPPDARATDAPTSG